MSDNNNAGRNNHVLRDAATPASDDPEADDGHTAVDAANLQSPLLGSTELIGGYFREMFGTEGWGDALRKRPPYRPGKVARTEESLAKRRLADPEARFYYSVMMSEACLLPLCVASNVGERDQFNAEIAAILGLDVAVERGWITSYMICWRQGHYPKSPKSVRVFSPRGRTAKSKALGELEPYIRRFVSFAKGDGRQGRP